MFAEALANTLGYPVLQVANADFASSYIGENMLKLRAIFEVAKEFAPCMLFFGKLLVFN